MAHPLQDLRYAFRRICRSPGFSLTVVLTLALGIGAGTVLFSIVDGVLLQPLAYRDSGQLVAVWERVPYLESMSPLVGPNPRHVLRWRQSQNVFAAMALVNEGTTGVALAGDHPRYVGRVAAEPNLLALLGVQPLLGRDFMPEEGTRGRTDRTIISWVLWQQLFGGSADVLGKTVQVGGSPMTVIGVMPQSFYFPKSNELVASGGGAQAPAVDVLVPRQVNAQDFGWNGDYGNYAVIGRLRPGVSVAAAQADLDHISDVIVHEAPAGQFDPGRQPALATVVQPLKQAVVGRAATGLYLLLAAVFGVLLIACINLANAQLARVLSRGREAALRVALGASAVTLVQSSVMESLLLACTGGALGIVFAHIVVEHFVGIVHIAIPRAANVQLNPAVLAVSVGCTMAATVLFGVLPALHYLRVRPQAALGSAGRAAGSAGSTALRRGLIAAQVLACTALLLLTTLFARNLLQLLHGNHGFSTGGTVQANLRLQGKAFSGPARAAFEDGLLDRLQTLPGVTSTALVSSLLNQGELWGDTIQPAGAPDSMAQLAQVRWISPGYFHTIGVPIVAGRSLTAADRTPVPGDDAPQLAPPLTARTPPAAAPIAAVLSDALVGTLWPHQDPLNRTFLRNGRAYRVVGIAAGARTNSPHEAPPSMVYLPYWDNPPYQPFVLVHLGTGQNLTALIPAIRTAIWQQNPGVIVSDIRPFADTFADTLAPERLQTALLAAFGIAALLLSLLGIYGTLNTSITRRTQEFGIRMALGATRWQMYALTLREIAGPIAFGFLAGWAVALAVTRIVRSLLQAAPAPGALSLLQVAGVLVAATLAATYAPCRRAANLQPMDALRTE